MILISVSEMTNALSYLSSYFLFSIHKSMLIYVRVIFRDVKSSKVCDTFRLYVNITFLCSFTFLWSSFVTFRLDGMSATVYFNQVSSFFLMHCNASKVDPGALVST